MLNRPALSTFIVHGCLFEIGLEQLAFYELDEILDPFFPCMHAADVWDENILFTASGKGNKRVDVAIASPCLNADAHEKSFSEIP